MLACWPPAARRRRRRDAPAPAPAPAARAGHAGGAGGARRRRVAAPFADAVARAGERLLQDAQATLGSGPRELVIDPLIDASTGQQTNGTVQMGAQLAAPDHAPRAALERAAADARRLASRPLLLIGTLTAINTKNVKDENADAFRICLVLIDLRTGKLVAKRVDRATLTTVDAEPLPLYRDSPTWALDATALAYIKSCQGSSPGDAIAPGYLQRLPAQAMINEAVLAFADNKPADAYRLYHEAQPSPIPRTCASSTASTSTSWKTGRKKEAAETFGKIVGIGLDAQEAADQDLLQPGHDDAAAVGRPAGPVRGLAARGRVAGRRARHLPAGRRPHQPAPATPPPTRCCRRSAPRIKPSLERQNRSSRRASSPTASARAR